MELEKTFPDIDLEKVLAGKINERVSEDLRDEIKKIETDKRIKDAALTFICNFPHSLARFIVGDFESYDLETAELLINEKGKPEAAATIEYHNAAHVALFLATMKDNYDKEEAVKIINRFVEVARMQGEPQWDLPEEVSAYKWTISHQIVAANIDEATSVLRRAINNYKNRPDYKAKIKELEEYFGDYKSEHNKIVKLEKVGDLGRLEPSVMRIKVLID